MTLTTCPSGGPATVSSLAAAHAPGSSVSGDGPPPPADARIAYWVEKAAAHQCRALRCLREIRDLDSARLSSSQTLTRQCRALQSLIAARRAVERAMAMASGTEYVSALHGHLAQLDPLIQAVERECTETEGRRIANLAR